MNVSPQSLDPPRLSEVQLERLIRRLTEAADQMTDAQVLALADSLHGTLRARRMMRGRFHQRIEQRLQH